MQYNPSRYEVDRKTGFFTVGYGYGSSPTFTNVTITGSTASTSTTTGALVVTGGVGIGGAVNVGGNLTVSGTGNSSVAGNFGIGTTSPLGTLSINTPNLSYGTVYLNGATTGADFMRLKSSGADAVFGIESSGGNTILTGSSANAAVLYSVGSTPLQFGTAGTVKGTLTASGNLLLGTTTDSSNGKLQLATHTTSAGGIGFGTDVSLYRFNTGQVVLDGTTGNSAVMWFAESGTRKGYLQSNAGNLNIYSTSGSVVLASNNTTALTLDSSQNATISGNATVNGASGITTTATNGFGLLHSAAASTFRGMKLQTSGSNRWLIAANNTAESGSNAGSDFVIYGYNDAGGFLNESLRITRSTGALTVGGTLIVSTSSTPASASATGIAGTVCWDSSYIYVCTATNTWKRVAIATW